MRVVQDLPETLLMSYLVKAQEAQQRGDRGTATQFYTLALRIDPDCSGALNNLAMMLAEDRQHVTAGICSRRAVAQNPDQLIMLANHAAILTRNQEYDEAISICERLVKEQPHECRFWRDLALATSASDIDRSLECLQRAEKFAPNSPAILRDLGLMYLTHRHWDIGFQKWRKSGFDSAEDTSFSVLPTWNGEDLTGKAIVVFHEQGLGDTIQFCRFLKLLEAERVILAVPSPLVRLMRMAGVADEVIDFADPAPVDIHYQVPLMFAWAYRSIKEALEGPFQPYLEAPANGPRVYRGPNTVLMVGVCWRGNPLYGSDKHRSMPFDLLLPLADMPGVQLVSLQKGAGSTDVHDMSAGVLVQDVSGQTGDLADLAYVVDNLDLVVSVDTSVLHLAGALGKQAVAMLPYNRCWRWSRNTSDTPFYPSVKLITQPTPGDWNSVVRKVRETIVSMIGDHRVPPEPQINYRQLDVPAKEF